MQNRNVCKWKKKHNTQNLNLKNVKHSDMIQFILEKQEHSTFKNPCPVILFVGPDEHVPRNIITLNVFSDGHNEVLYWEHQLGIVIYERELKRR